MWRVLVIVSRLIHTHVALFPIFLSKIHHKSTNPALFYKPNHVARTIKRNAGSSRLSKIIRVLSRDSKSALKCMHVENNFSSFPIVIESDGKIGKRISKEFIPDSGPIRLLRINWIPMMFVASIYVIDILMVTILRYQWYSINYRPRFFSLKIINDQCRLSMRVSLSEYIYYTTVFHVTSKLHVSIHPFEHRPAYLPLVPRNFFVSQASPKFIDPSVCFYKNQKKYICILI